MSMRRVTHDLAIALAIASLMAVSAAAQQKQPTGAPKPAAKASAKTFTPPKTPWGDPDLQGVYTNKDESGIPIERPAQFEGKSLDDVDDSEFAEIVRQRNEAARARAPLAGGAKPAPVRSTGSRTTTRRTAGPGSWSIRRTDAFRRRRPNRRSGRPIARRQEPAMAPPIRTRIAASTISASRAGFRGR